MTKDLNVSTILLALGCYRRGIGPDHLSGDWQQQLSRRSGRSASRSGAGRYLGLHDYRWGAVFRRELGPWAAALRNISGVLYSSLYLSRVRTGAFWEEKDRRRRPSSRLRTTSAPTNRRAPYDGQSTSITEFTPRHTWLGFSTGKWDGDHFTVYTTHIKQGWVRRNGLTGERQGTLVEHFHSHGDHLTHVSIVTDPCISTEPLLQVPGFHPESALEWTWLWPCEYVVEAPRRKGAFQTYLPGAQTRSTRSFAISMDSGNRRSAAALRPCIRVPVEVERGGPKWDSFRCCGWGRLVTCGRLLTG